jgi:hypothetical protein
MPSLTSHCTTGFAMDPPLGFVKRKNEKKR